MNVDKSPDEFEEHDEKEIFNFLDGLDVIDSWDDKSIDNAEPDKLDADSETNIASGLIEKDSDDSFRNKQTNITKSARPKVDRHCSTSDTRHKYYLHSPGREGRGNMNSYRNPNRTYRDVRNNKVHKVKNYLNPLEIDDNEDKPLGSELDYDIEYVLKRREVERRRSTKLYKSRSRSYSRERERRHRSPSREHRRKGFTPPRYTKYPNLNYGPHNDSARGSIAPNMPAVSYEVENGPRDIPLSEPSLMPVYYPNVEYQPHYAPPVLEPAPFLLPSYPTLHDNFPPPQVLYDAPYIPPPMNEPLTYAPSYQLPPVGDVPAANRHSLTQPSPQEALDSMLLEGKISMQDYSKLTTKSASGPVENIKYHELNLHNKADVLLRCHDAVLKLEGLRLPNQLFVPPGVEAIPPSEVKYSSPLKRIPVQYSFTLAANKNNTQNKLLLSKIVHTLGLQKVDLKKPKRKVSIREISTQTVSVDCYTCKIRQMTKNVSVKIQVDRADFTKSCHSQVIDQELASSKMIFGHGSNAASAPISLTHLTSAQIVSSLANKAKILQSQRDEPEDNNYYRRFQPDNSTSHHQGQFGNKNPRFNPSGGSNASYSHNQNSHNQRPYWSRKN